MRRPIRAERLLGVPFGAGLGFLYSVTTISGPPLAVLFNNQGMVKQEFRAGLGLVRTTESVLTAIAYYQMGLFVAHTAEISSWILPGILVCMPLGAYAIRKLDPETFRRVCMSFDVWIVGFGLSRVLMELKIAESPYAYAVLAVAGLVDACLLYRFFSSRTTTAATAPSSAQPSGAAVQASG